MAADQVQDLYQPTSGVAPMPGSGESEEQRGISPLMQAVLGRHFDTAQTLLDEGAAVDEREHAGRTALFMATVTGNVEGVKWLLDRGADVNATSDFGYSPLMAVSTYAGTAEITDLLLKHGASISTSIGVDALDLAIETGRLEAARVLIARWGPLDANKLVGAADARNIDMVRLLLASGADVNAPRPDGLTPLIISAMFNDVEIIELLLAAGADVNAVTTNSEVVAIMAASGAHPVLLNATGVTALMLAERNGNDALVQRLRDAGAYR